MKTGTSLATTSPNGNATATATYTIPNTYGTWSIGLDRQLDILREFQDSILPKATSYPPYNILKMSEDRYEVELAVAGFSKEDIEVTVKNGVLTVRGTKPDALYIDRQGEVLEYLHKGIAARSFMQTFALGEYVNVVGARHENGILTIELERILPEELRERIVNIK